MVRKLLIGMLACGVVWTAGTGAASSHDDAWPHDTAPIMEGQSPPDSGILASYGEWVGEPGVGHVWRPHVAADWRPYWRGHWTWRGDWVWVSADPWGDGPFHFGEWIWSVRWGWVWVPGTVWAPARVTWIVSGPVVAWAPASIHVTVGGDPRYWVYSDARTFRGRVVHPYRVPPAHVTIRHGTTVRDFGRVFVPEKRHRNREERSIVAREETSQRRFDRGGLNRRSTFGERSQDGGDNRMRGNQSRTGRGFDLKDR
jgi:hypothetical protein